MNRTTTLPRRPVLASVGSVLGGGTLLGAGCLGADADHTPSRREEDWRMYGRDPGRTRFVPDADLPRDGVDIAWQRSVSASSWRPPVVADGTVYCQYSNGLFVVDRDTGEGPRVGTYGGFGRGTGPMAFGSTKLYRDGVLVVPYGDSIAGYAADSDGWPETVSGLGESRARWWIDGDGVGTSPPAGRSADAEWLASPLVVDGAIVSLHATSNVVSAVDTDDGGSRWRVDLEETTPAGDYYVTPVGHVVDTASETVVVKAFLRAADTVVSSTLLAGIDLADGTLEWTADDTPPIQRSRESQDSLAARDGTVYATDWAEQHDELRLRELEVATGDSGWSRALERTAHIGLALDETAAYHVGSRPAEEGSDPFVVVAINRNDGSTRWERTIDDRPGNAWSPYTPPPTVADEQLLVPGEKGLHALDRTTGDHLWTFTEMVGTSGGGETTRAGLTPAVVSGDRIVLGTTLMLYGLE